MFLSGYGRNEWLTIAVVGALLGIAAAVVGWWVLCIPIALVTIALLLFFRDPERRPPVQKNIMVAPADGRVSSVHELEHFEPLGGPATCIRIFLSVLDVHINRSPCHGQVSLVQHKPGEHMNALNPDSAEANESNLIVMLHPIRRYPVAAVRQVAGLLARTIACGVREGDIVQRAQRIGMIKLGSTTELYIPADLKPAPTVQVGQKVKGGLTVVATYTSRDNAAASPNSAASASDGGDTITGGSPTPTPTPEAAAEPSLPPEPETEPAGVTRDTGNENAHDDDFPSPAAT